MQTIARRVAIGSLLAAAAALALGGMVGSGHADSRGRPRTELSEDEIREAVRRGEIRPYAEVLPVALKAHPGEVVSVKVKRRHGRLVYELKIITTQGRLREIYIDGATLEIVKVE